VLLVGTLAGHKGQYSAIQAAVDAAHPGDWILVAPGDYHETDDIAHPPADSSLGNFAAVLITTPGIHLRGMSRAGVVVDGTRSGSGTTCSRSAGEQNFGTVSGGKAQGRNGIVVWKTDGVSVDNLTVCNFLTGGGDAGNGVWFNGGEGSGKVGEHGFEGSYLTATSTYFGTESDASGYGIFASNASGGSWNHIYASNMNDSGMYIGACQQVCDTTVDHAWMEYNALGYSGTNSGGRLLIEDSQFDNNQDGLDTNTQIAGDPPAPQNGACPNGGVSPITHTHSCLVIMHNWFHDNNNPDVPEAGNAAQGPPGTGMTLSGGRNDTVMDNTFSNNGAWGTLFVPYPDSGTPSLGQSCPKTGGVETPGFGCVYDPEGDALLHNTYVHNGFFGNPTNGDFGQVVTNAGQPQNCYRGNVAPNGSTPSDLEQAQPTCGAITTAPNLGGALLGQVLCDTGFGSCPAGSAYPPHTGVVLHPLPTLASMPNPCEGVPANPWCPSGRPL